MQIAPSLLSCDFSQIGKEVKRMEQAGADLIHLDVMDGRFVPNITFGAPVIRSVRSFTKLPFDVHLMIEDPLAYIDDFANAGADIITFHVEARSDIEKTIAKIKAAGVKPGLVIKPGTPAETVFPYLEELYMVLVMTVEPGFGGQRFMEHMMPKVAQIKAQCQKKSLHVFLEADGGINEETIGVAAKSGVDICVSGTGIFKASNAKAAIDRLKRLASQGGCMASAIAHGRPNV